MSELLSSKSRSLASLGMTVVRRLRDRALHPLRARTARENLKGRRVRNVLVLCYGNICRSPLLQVSLLKHLAERGRRDIRVRSAGFVGPGRSSPDLAISVAGAMGYDLRSHRSVLLSANDLQWTDLIIVMSGDQATDVRWRGAPAHVPVVVLGDMDPEPIEGRTIADPWNGDESAFRSSYRRIDRCAEELAKILVCLGLITA
jgi:protein-tyrosine phosphatase